PSTDIDFTSLFHSGHRWKSATTSHTSSGGAATQISLDATAGALWLICISSDRTVGRGGRGQTEALAGRVPRRRRRGGAPLLARTAGRRARGSTRGRGGGMADARRGSRGRRPLAWTRPRGLVLAALLRGRRHRPGAGAGGGPRRLGRAPRRAVGDLQGLRGQPLRVGAGPRRARVGGPGRAARATAGRGSGPFAL